MQASPSNTRNWLVAGLVGLLLILILALVDLEAVWQALTQTRWSTLGEATAVFLLGAVLISVRWQHLLNMRAGWLNVFQADSTGYMLAAYVPIPSTFLRIMTTNQITGVAAPQVIAGITLERLLNVIERIVGIVVAVQLVTTETIDQPTSIAGPLIFIVAVFGLLAWLLKRREQVAAALARGLERLPWFSEDKAQEIASNLLQGLAAAGSWRRLASLIGLSLMMWACFFGFQFLALVALSPDLPVRHMLLVSAVVMVAIPPSAPMMLGIYEAIVIGAIAAFQLLEPEMATAYAVVLHLPQMLCWTVLGMWSYSQTNIRLSMLLQGAGQATNGKS
jgi:uncharacterized protein (TIRG00374 family)